ncbi:MAG: hypothetical protein WCJ51_02910, partial [Candidatus Moraniibacteriota bacterium]
LLFIGSLTGCSNSAEENDRKIVDSQQKIYGDEQPVHIYDYSIPRDIYQQIYDITTTQALATYSVVETIDGRIKYRGPSIGFPIPADMQLTNPLQPAYHSSGSVAIEQSEPNGLFSSKNTNATWVLFVDLESGNVFPMYSEHHVSCWPFVVKEDDKGEWHRADNKPIKFKLVIDTTRKIKITIPKKNESK